MAKDKLKLTPEQIKIINVIKFACQVWTSMSADKVAALQTLLDIVQSGKIEKRKATDEELSNTWDELNKAANGFKTMQKEYSVKQKK